MWFHKSSLTAESIRSIRTSLLARQEMGQPLQVLVVTSLHPGHGKTSLVSNLGIAYAELGRSVLIIDGDVRSPSLHRIFGLNNEAGLINTLQSNELLSGGSVDLPIQATDVPSLSLLSAGPFASNVSSSSLFHSQSMENLLSLVRDNFDVVLIDTPPLTLADARILGRGADGVVLVLGAGEVRMDSVQAAEERLVQDGCRVLGTVLNNWDPRANGYGVYPERYHESTYFQPGKSR
jgi:receptor protein-tyrosine kinase